MDNVTDQTRVTVPREPTEAMIDAFVARALQVSVHGEGGWTNYARNQWAQMLAAAPATPHTPAPAIGVERTMVSHIDELTTEVCDGAREDGLPIHEPSVRQGVSRAIAAYASMLEANPAPAQPSEVEAYREALEWIEMFATVRADDSQRVAAKVQRGAMTTIAGRARTALTQPTTPEKGNGTSEATNEQR